MAGIHKLPQELLQMVLTHLQRKDLSALSCTSKHLRPSVEPTLYRDMCWKQRDVINHHHPPAHLLLRTLLSRRELAFNINRLAVCCTKPDDAFTPFSSIWKKGKPEFSNDDTDRMMSLIFSLGFIHESWVANVVRGNVDIFIALLILLSTNLRRLQLDLDFLKGSDFIGDALKKAAAENWLHLLEQVEYGNDLNRTEDIELHHAIDYGQIKPLFSIPSLRSLSMSLPSRDISWFPGQKVPLSGLRSLVLHHSQLTPENLETILMATPSLKSLRYETWMIVYEPLDRSMDTWQFFDCAQLSRALDHVQESLEDLFVSVRFLLTDDVVFTEDELEVFRGSTGKLDNLLYFKRLAKLTIPTTLLSGSILSKEKSYSNLKDIPEAIAALLPMSIVEICLSNSLDQYGIVGPRDLSDDEGTDDDDDDDIDLCDMEYEAWMFDETESEFESDSDDCEDEDEDGFGT